MGEKFPFDIFMEALDRTCYGWSSMEDGPYFYDSSGPIKRPHVGGERPVSLSLLDVSTLERKESFPNLVLRTNYLDDTFLKEKDAPFENRHAYFKNAELGDNTIITTSERPAEMNLSQLKSIEPFRYGQLMEMKRRIMAETEYSFEIKVMESQRILFKEDYGKFYIGLESLIHPKVLSEAIITLATVQHDVADFIQSTIINPEIDAYYKSREKLEKK